MNPRVIVNAHVERIQGNLAIISVADGRDRTLPVSLTSPEREKKYLVLLRRYMPAAAEEGGSVRLSLAREGVRNASSDLQKTLRDARLFNEVIDYMK